MFVHKFVAMLLEMSAGGTGVVLVHYCILCLVDTVDVSLVCSLWELMCVMFLLGTVCEDSVHDNLSVFFYLLAPCVSCKMLSVDLRTILALCSALIRSPPMLTPLVSTVQSMKVQLHRQEDDTTKCTDILSKSSRHLGSSFRLTVSHNGTRFEGDTLHDWSDACNCRPHMRPPAHQHCTTCPRFCLSLAR